MAAEGRDEGAENLRFAARWLDQILIDTPAAVVAIVVLALVAMLISGSRRRVGAIAAVILTVATLVGRWWFVSEGYIFQASQVRLLDVMLAAEILVVFGLVVARHWPSSSVEQGIGILAGALGLPVAAYAALQVAVPPTPRDIELRACDGAVTAGSRFTVSMPVEN